MEIKIPTWQVGIDKVPQCRERPLNKWSSSIQTKLCRWENQSPERTTDMPNTSWPVAAKVRNNILSQTRKFPEAFSATSAISKKSVPFHGKLCSLWWFCFKLSSGNQDSLFFFLLLNILRNISLSFIIANYNLDMKTWANLACFSFGIWGWKSIELERQIQSSYFKISAHTRIHTPVSQNEVGVGGRKTKRPSKSGLPQVTCLQTSACHLPSLSEPMLTHTHTHTHTQVRFLFLGLAQRFKHKYPVRGNELVLTPRLADSLTFL